MTTTQFAEWYYQLPILAYGELDDEEVLKAFKTVLRWKADGIFISEDIPDNLYTVHEYWLYLGLLKDCIEYGTSPRGAWLTDLGESVLQFLETDDFVELHEQLGIS